MMPDEEKLTEKRKGLLAAKLALLLGLIPQHNASVSDVMENFLVTSDCKDQA